MEKSSYMITLHYYIVSNIMIFTDNHKCCLSYKVYHIQSCISEYKICAARQHNSAPQDTGNVSFWTSKHCGSTVCYDRNQCGFISCSITVMMSLQYNESDIINTTPAVIVLDHFLPLSFPISLLLSVLLPFFSFLLLRLVCLDQAEPNPLKGVSIIQSKWRHPGLPRSFPL